MTCSPPDRPSVTTMFSPACAAGLDAPDRRLSVLDNKDVDTLLISDQRGLRHDDLLFGRPRFQVYGHQLTVDERACRDSGTPREPARVSVARSTVTSTKSIWPTWS